MGNCSSSRRKIPHPPNKGISTAIKNVTIDDISERKKFKRAYSKDNIFNKNNININNNEKEKQNLKINMNNNSDINNNIIIKSKSKEKIINDNYSIKSFKLNNSNTKQSSKCKIKYKNKIPRNTFNPNTEFYNNNNSRNYKIKKIKSNINTYTYNAPNNENINILNQEIPYLYHNNNSNNNNIDKNSIHYQCIKTIEGHSEKIVSMIELYNGNIATGSYDNKIKIWNLETLECVKTINEEGYIFCLLEMEPNIILSGTNKNSIQLFNLNNNDNNNLEYSFKGHDLWINCLVKCSPNFFASGSNDSFIKVWDYKNKILFKTLKGHQDCILTMILFKNKKLCSGSADLTIRIWDWISGQCEFFFVAHEKWVKCLCELNLNINKNYDILISGSDDMKIKIWKIFSNIEDNFDKYYFEKYKIFVGHKHSVRTLCHIEKDIFASGSFDGSIKIWKLNEDKEIQTLEGHNSYVISVIKIKNGDLVSCSNDHTIKLWRKT